MTEKHYDVQAVKDRLTAYRETDRELESYSEMLERLTAKMEGVGAQNITDLPKSPSPSNDRLSDLMAQKIEIEESVGDAVAKQKSERAFFEKILKKLKKADEKAVIRYRYFVVMNWSDVTNAMFGDKADYLIKEDSYFRRVMKLHGLALLHIAMYIEDGKIG